MKRQWKSSKMKCTFCILEITFNVKFRSYKLWKVTQTLEQTLGKQGEDTMKKEPTSLNLCLLGKLCRHRMHYIAPYKQTPMNLLIFQHMFSNRVHTYTG